MKTCMVYTIIPPCAVALFFEVVLRSLWDADTRQKGAFHMDTCFRDLKILLAQESASRQAVLTEMLESGGAKVTACRSIQAFLPTFERGPASFDAILTDLPATGPEANAMLLRLWQTVPQIPLVIIGSMRAYEGYSFPFGLDIAARIFEPLSRSQLETCFMRIPNT